jgi:hypothetical protein
MDAISWLLVSTGPTVDINGAPIPEGTAVARQMWDGEAEWTAPENTRIEPDDGRQIWQPEAASTLAEAAARARTMPVQTWLDRLPPDVLGAIVMASRTDGRLMMALTLLAARGRVDLADPTGLLRDLLGHAVRATAAASSPLTTALADALLSS